MDSRISNVNNLLNESKKNKSKTFIDKIIGFFTQMMKKIKMWKIK